MNRHSLKDLARASGFSLADRTGIVRVIVDLQTPQADAGDLGRLKGLGLTVRQIVKNKVIGSIDAECLPALRADALVREVEVSTPLKPHRRE